MRVDAHLADSGMCLLQLLAAEERGPRVIQVVNTRSFSIARIVRYDEVSRIAFKTRLDIVTTDCLTSCHLARIARALPHERPTLERSA